ncbi:hypothetical protein GCM10009552_00890 [Rothia nasimurium]
MVRKPAVSAGVVQASLAGAAKGAAQSRASRRREGSVTVMGISGRETGPLCDVWQGARIGHQLVAARALAHP